MIRRRRRRLAPIPDPPSHVRVIPPPATHPLDRPRCVWCDDPMPAGDPDAACPYCRATAAPQPQEDTPR